MTTITLPRWRQIQRSNITRHDQLIEFLKIEKSAALINPSFPLNIPLRLAQKMPKGTLDDPLIRQFIPLIEETHITPGFTPDPVGDRACQRTPKLLHKYNGRALLVTTSACAMHCRYCFRQQYPYETQIKDYIQELDIIARDDTISEVILSGGDPLSLSDHKLQHLIDQLNQIPHIRRIRLHSRFPIGIPERITLELLHTLTQSPKQIYFVTHINHPRELDDTVLAALGRLQHIGIPVLNQAVLLHRVNDDIDTLHQLFETLADHAILPYYLHQLDRVQGTAHFEVPTSKGLHLLNKLRTRLPGYAIPQYVQDLPGTSSKVVII
ncbi:MAG: KamA family radical SAM protein [Chlamydiales bacterium]|nr:KamA family radical SAM protein [Chlamydiales bacterium]